MGLEGEAAAGGDAEGGDIEDSGEGVAVDEGLVVRGDGGQLGRGGGRPPALAERRAVEEGGGGSGGGGEGGEDGWEWGWSGFGEGVEEGERWWWFEDEACSRHILTCFGKVGTDRIKQVPVPSPDQFWRQGAVVKSFIIYVISPDLKTIDFEI